MATPIQLIITARDDSANVLRGTVANFDNLATAALRAGDSLARGGASVGQWKSAMTSLGGDAARALGSVSTEAQNAVSAISQVGGAVASFGAVGLVIAAASFALRAFTESAAQAQARIENVAKPFESLQAQLRAMDATPLDNISQAAGRSSNELTKLAETSIQVREALLAVAEAQERVAVASERARVVAEAQSNTYGMLNQNAAQYGVSIQGLLATLTSAPQFFGGMFTAIQQGAGITGNFSKVLNDLDEATIKAEHAASVHAIALRNEADAMAAANSHAATYAASLGHLIELTAGQANAAASLAQADATVDGWMVRLGAGNKAYNDVQERGTKRTDEYNAANQRLAEQGLARARAAMQQLIGTLRGVVEGVLQATSVTDEDMGLAAIGKYVDKWDEFRRRLDAVASGTSAAKFGAQFEQMFNKLGMSAEEAARKFKDFSLFANPANLKLINWDAIVGSTQEAIDSIIGKYNVVTAGVQAYLASDAAKAQLPQLKLALGLDASATAADLQESLTGALGGITGGGAAGGEVKTKLAFDATQAKNDAATLKQLIAQIPATPEGTLVKTIVDVLKADTFDDALEEISGDLAKIPASADVVVTLKYNAPVVVGGGSPTQPQANPIPTVPQQHGGSGVLLKDTLFYAHKGEAYWFSGVPNRVPMPGGRGGNTFNFMVTVDSMAREDALMRRVRAIAGMGA